MAYYTIPPPKILEPFIRFFWVFELDGIKNSGRPYVYRSLADGCPELLFHYQGIFEELTPQGKISSFRLGLHAQSRHFSRFQTMEDFGIFGAYLYPFALESLFGIPAAELSDQAIGLDTLLGNRVSILKERLAAADNNQKRYQVMSTFLEALLLSRRPDIPPIYGAVKSVIAQKGEIDILQLADYQNISLRQFQRKFKSASGFSPKLYSRILRFSKVAASLGGDFKDLTALAYEHEYYDQSHFIHEFREFSGYTPRDYFAGSPEGREWLEDA